MPPPRSPDLFCLMVATSKDKFCPTTMPPAAMSQSPATSALIQFDVPLPVKTGWQACRTDDCPTDDYSILHRMFGCVDDHHFERRFNRLQLQPELLLQRREKRRHVRIGCRFGDFV